MFGEFIALWNLSPAGEPIKTQAGALLPVMWQGLPAMLKVSLAEEERRGCHLMEWWGGEGAAKVYAREGDALLLERATGERSLAEMSANGRDDEATRIICTAASRLHAVSKQSPPDVVPLKRWFQALEMAALDQGGVFIQGFKVAEELLADPGDVKVLHGDIHHGNILDFGGRGWLAIDPKGLCGERGFDFANLFCNPDETAADPARFDRRLAIVCEAAGLDRIRMLKWIAAWSGLSAAFHLEDGESPDGAFEIMQLAMARLG